VILHKKHGLVIVTEIEMEEKSKVGFSIRKMEKGVELKGEENVFKFTKEEMVADENLVSVNSHIELKFHTEEMHSIITSPIINIH